MSMENIAGARKPAKREDEHTVAGEHRMMRRADREVTDPERIAAIVSGIADACVAAGCSMRICTPNRWPPRLAVRTS